MSVMKDTVNLRPYTADGTPNIEGNDQRWLREEFRHIQDSIRQLVIAAKALETRLVAGGL
jgi:hypothetical protein